MRILEFEVDGQTIRKKPECDFSNIVAGTSGFLRAKFSFSSEWRGCLKAASFWRGKKEYPVLLDRNACDIPPEALVGATFRVSVLGKNGDFRIPTNSVLVKQEVTR